MNDEQLYLQPAAGLRVVDPQTRKPLPTEGASVTSSTYWVRRLRDGDVAEAAPPAPTQEEQAPVQTEGEAASKPARNK